ncbi:MAG: galactokinase family protein, partial [Bacteroidota bacterium]
EYQIKRYNRLISSFESTFSEKEYQLFSSPGRTEIGGNHTDHNHGRVLAASINLDSIAAVAANKDNQVTLYSEGYKEPFIVNLNQLSPIKEEEGDTKSLIRGIASRFEQLNYDIGGFDAVMTSDVLQGSGLSSSASIEVLIGTVLNVFYNDSNISADEIAKISQYAENEYFGKPCGLMDQMACAVGGIISIDFEDTENPIVEKIEFDFESTGYDLIVIDTGGNHADLTDEYSAIPSEMKSVANYFGKTFCHEIDFEMLLANISELRLKLGDRAILRALHFLSENERVIKQVKRLRENNFNKFLTLVKESGNSSFKWLQNIYPCSDNKEQGLTLALALTEKFIEEHGNGVCRVHGGGFAGTIQVFIQNSLTQKYKEYIESIFGIDSATLLSIRSSGSMKL